MGKRKNIRWKERVFLCFKFVKDFKYREQKII